MCCAVLSHSVVSDSLRPYGLYSPEILQARMLEWIAFPFPRNLPNPGIKPRSPTLQADSLPAKPQGKSKNIGLGSLFLLQWIFLTQGLNKVFPYYRQTLYHLKPQRSQYLHETYSVVSELVAPWTVACQAALSM